VFQNDSSFVWNLKKVLFLAQDRKGGEMFYLAKGVLVFLGMEKNWLK